ncbi:uncharacterized protein LOC144201226 [Stigmatopora nigra]
MHACCVRGCSNSSCSGAKVKFYRLPTSYRPFQAERRRLWLRALQRVADVAVDEGEDGDHGDQDDQDENEELWQNARICGAHFLSGRVSMDPQDVDFVPSVFPTLSEEEEENGEKSDTREPKRHRTDEGQPETGRPGTSPPSAEAARGTKAEERRSAHPGDGVSPSLVPPWASSKMPTISPVVVLRPMSLRPPVAPSGGKRQEPASPRLLPPPSAFPCNMCERRFTNAHLLKRHKLLHVKDDRKCARCGALFCRVHRRAPAGVEPRPSARVRPPSDSDYVPDEARARQRVGPAASGGSVRAGGERRPFPPSPGYVLEPGEVVERLEDFETSWNFIPLLTGSLLAAAPGGKDPGAEPGAERGGPAWRPRLPPALRTFSPLYLTSAFLRVERNYRYLLSKAAKVPGSGQKEAGESLPTEPPLSSLPPSKRAAAFDLEIAL